jgi:hypothetical protein
MRARTFLSRRNFSESGCSMKITEDVRKFAAEQKLSEDQALQAGLEQKVKEFVEKGSEVYAKMQCRGSARRGFLLPRDEAARLQ